MATLIGVAIHDVLRVDSTFAATIHTEQTWWTHVSIVRASNRIIEPVAPIGCSCLQVLMGVSSLWRCVPHKCTEYQ